MIVFATNQHQGTDGQCILSVHHTCLLKEMVIIGQSEMRTYVFKNIMEWNIVLNFVIFFT